MSGGVRAVAEKLSNILNDGLERKRNEWREREGVCCIKM